MSRIELPPEPVRTFILENPTYKDWKKYLYFLVDNFPQVKDDQIQYLIEGGAAMHLHMPDTSRDLFNKPHDIDIICRSQELADQFYPKLTFDAKTAEDWFLLRKMQYSEEKEGLLLQCFTPISSESRQILVLDKVTLSLSKKLPFNGCPQRFKDVFDVKALGISEDQTNRLKQKLA